MKNRFFFIVTYIIFTFITICIFNLTTKVELNVTLNIPADQNLSFIYENNNKLKEKLALVKGNVIFKKFSVSSNVISIKKQNTNELIKNSDIKEIKVNEKIIQNFSQYPKAIKEINNASLFKYFLYASFLYIMLCIIIKLLTLLYCNKEYVKTFIIKIIKNNTLHKFINTTFFITFPIALFPYKHVYISTLDNSWQYLFNILHKNSYIPGKDYFFTYGPLGFLMAPQNIDNNLLISITVNFALVLIVWIILLYQYRTKLIPANKMAFFSIIFLLFVAFHDESFWVYTTLILSISLLQLHKTNIKISILITSLLSIISSIALMIKFNLGVELFGISGICYLIMLAETKKNSIKYLYVFFLTYLTLLLFYIKFLFLNLNNFFAWFTTSLEIATGYGNAMQIINSYHHLFFSLIIITIFISLLIISAQKDKNTFKNLLLTLPILFFSFKHGFIRQEGHHTLEFFIFVVYLIGLIYLYTNKKNFKQVLISFFTIFIISMFYTHNSQLLSTNYYPKILQNALCINNIYTYKKEYINRQNYVNSVLMQNSKIIEKYANNSFTVEILPWDISYAKIYNIENLSINPIIQLYSVYTNKLDKISSEHYKKEKSPNIIIFENKTIDSRLLYFDTPATWNTIFQNYNIEEYDENFIILKNKNKQKNIQYTKISENNYILNEDIELPQINEMLFAEILITKTFLERIKSFIFRGSEINCEITYFDNSTLRYKVISDTLKANTLINYTPIKIEDYISIFKNSYYRDMTKIKSIKFTGNKKNFNKNIKINWYKSNFAQY